ncbi:hypothetical protein [Nocardia xishanensis]
MVIFDPIPALSPEPRRSPDRLTSADELLNEFGGSIEGGATFGRLALNCVGLHCDPAPLTPQGRSCVASPEAMAEGHP